MGEIEKKWYVLRAIGGKEKKVKEMIETGLCFAGTDTNGKSLPDPQWKEDQQGTEFLPRIRTDRSCTGRGDPAYSQKCYQCYRFSGDKRGRGTHTFASKRGEQDTGQGG